MRPLEGEKVLSFDIKSFLTTSRKNYFCDKLRSYFEEDLAESEENQIHEDTLINSFAALCDEYFRKLVYFANSQGQKITKEDIPLISESFSEMLSNFKVKSGDQISTVGDLNDWVEHLDMLLLESEIIQLDDKIGIDAMAELASEVVVKNLDQEAIASLLENFQKEIHARVDKLIGLDDYLREELLDRTKYYLEEVFPSCHKELGSPESCLVVWVGQISEFIEENATDFTAFLVNINTLEQDCIEVLSHCDGIIAKNLSYFQNYLKEYEALGKSRTVEEVRAALVRLWFSMYVESMVQAKKAANKVPEFSSRQPGGFGDN